jgi:hypothetical protein
MQLQNKGKVVCLYLVDEVFHFHPPSVPEDRMDASHLSSSAESAKEPEPVT